MGWGPKPIFPFKVRPFFPRALLFQCLEKDWRWCRVFCVHPIHRRVLGPLTCAELLACWTGREKDDLVCAAWSWYGAWGDPG